MHVMIWSKWEDALGLGLIFAGATSVLGYFLRSAHDGEYLHFNTILELPNEAAVADFKVLVAWTVAGFLVGLAIGAWLFVKRNWFQELPY